MSLIIQDDFNSDSVGSPPSGWSGLNGGATVVNFGVPPPHVPPGGPQHAAGLNGSIYVTFSPLTTGVVCFSFTTTERNILDVMMNLKSTGVGGTFNLITLQVEHDLSISALTPAGLMTDIHTLLPTNSIITAGWSTYPNKFDFYQVNFVLAENFDHSIQASVTLIINGNTIFNGTGNTGLFTTSQCPASVSTIEFVNTTIGIPGSYLDNVTVDNDPLSSYPFPGNPTTFQDFTSQLSLEHLDQPDTEKVYDSQLSIEHLDLPDIERVYLSQLVIEVIHAKAAAPPGGWSVKEM